MPIRLTTPRLLIAPFLPTDAPALFTWASDPAPTRYMGWPRHQTLADSEAVIRYFESVSASQPPKYDRPLVLRDKATGRPLGSSGIHQAGEAAVELGWILREDARRQGYAQEAAEALLRYAMEELPWVKRVEARAHPENATSIRLMKKLGMTELEGGEFPMPQLGGQKVWLVRYGISRER